ncbi:MAG: CHAT domain-containing protein [Rhodoglobus sp.]
MSVIEDLLGMGMGYVLDFSNATFTRFFGDYDIDIDEPDYAAGGTSKANRLRTFLRTAPRELVSRVLRGLLEHRELQAHGGLDDVPAAKLEYYRALIDRLERGEPPVPPGAAHPPRPSVHPPAVALPVAPPQPPPPSPPMRPRSSTIAPFLLFLSANPEDAKLDLDREQNRVVAARGKSTHKSRIRIEGLPDLHLPQLPDTLRLHRPGIVHFAGHGDVDGSLVMKDQDGEPCPMRPAGLVRLLALRKDSVRLVVLNACFSAELAQLLAADIDCVIGMSDEVSDGAATLFAEVFYSALFEGETVAQAFETSAASVAARYPGESHVPQITMKSGVNAADLALDLGA